MDLQRVVDGIAEDLRRAGAIGGAETARIAGLLVAGIETSLRLHLLEALSEAAAELSTSAPGAHVELGIESGEPVLVLRADGPGDDDKTEPGEPFLTYGAEGEELARLTLRLPDALKIRVEAAAAGAGASINTFIVTALARALETPSRARTTSSSRRVVARRMTGFVQG